MDIKQLEKYFIYNQPVPYKELLIYPVQMKDYLDFHLAVNCLVIEKNKIPDPKIISMSYLDFLFHMMNKQDETSEIYSYMFIELFRLCLHIKPERIKYKYNENGKVNLILNLPYECKSEIDSKKFFNDVFLDKDKLNNLYKFHNNPIELIQNNNIHLFSQLSRMDIKTSQMVFDLYNRYIETHIEYKDFVFDKNDFDEIKKIILYQNIPDYDDTYIDPKVEQVLKEAQEFMSKNRKKMCSLEDQIICVLISTPLDEEKINNLTIRKFSKILERVDYKLHYSIYKQAEMSGMVSFKEEISHWMCELKKDKYSDVIVDYGEFKNKMQNVT